MNILSFYHYINNILFPGQKNIKQIKPHIQLKMKEAKSPSRKYYLPIGYIPKPDRDSNTLNEIVEKDPTKIINITKHYRRYFKTGLEAVNELNIKSPFYTSYLRRSKGKDKEDETAIFNI